MDRGRQQAKAPPPIGADDDHSPADLDRGDVGDLSTIDDLPDPEPEAPSAWAIELARADALMSAGADEQRSVDDRIDDYEKALRILRDVQAKAPLPELPADLAERIAGVDRELERLRLSAFFTDP
jgi:hypothetical protein